MSNSAPLIGVNLLFIEARPLTGPGYYALEVFEKMAALAQHRRTASIKGYAQESARHHFSSQAQGQMTFLNTGSNKFLRVLFEQICLPMITKRDGVKLLFSPAFVSPLWGAPKLVATICDMYYRVIPEVVGRMQLKYWKLMIPASARACDTLITISDNSKRDMIRYLPVEANDIVVTPLASRMPMEDTIGELPLDEEPYLLVVANLTKNKNISRVVDALVEVRRRGIPYQLIHVGSDLNGELADAIDRTESQAFVRSVGKVDDAKLAGFYQSAFATIVASLYEGFGMPAVEAQAMGSPLICSNSSALPEAAGEGALYFSPTSIAELADRIVELHDNDGLRQTLIERGLANAATMSWDLTAERTLDALEAVLR